MNHAMVLKVGIIMSVISIVMLVIYGTDAMMAASQHLGPQSTAFLHMDVQTRGAVFGIIPAAMLIISFFITRKEPSKGLGVLIIIGGALMIIGVVAILALQGGDIQDAAKRDFGGVVGIGIVIVVLGTIKIKKSRQTKSGG
jgi:peptidoglycan/LPS O-acetylase OafA/YrhL